MRLAPGSLPPPLALRVEAAVAEAELPTEEVRTGRRVKVNVLRRRVQVAKPTPRFGLVFGASAALAILLLFHLVLLACVAGIAAAATASAAERRVRLRRWTLDPDADLLEAAGEVAEFGEIELAALAIWRDPRADADVRAEVVRLLAEDARLLRAKDEIEGADPKPIEAERLKLRLALAKAEGEEREAIEASLALCERRLLAAERGAGLRRRIEAYRGLVLQSLRAAGEGLGRAGADAPPELAAVREAAEALVRDVGAVESAVQEMRRL